MCVCVCVEDSVKCGVGDVDKESKRKKTKACEEETQEGGST